jgi:lipoate-protein ligase A
VSLAATWDVIDRHGAASELFDAAWFDSFGDRRTAVRLHPSGPTVVLGSSQRDEVVDLTEAGRLGVEVVRRRSGGGAVWLDDSLVWLDIVVPAGDRLGDGDVHKAFYWLGDLFAAALQEVDPTGSFAVHRGSLARDPLNKLICFAGRGPGEVTRNGRKVVGISQRRTKRYTLFQCGVLRSWAPLPLVRLLRPGLAASELLGTSGNTDRQSHVMDELGIDLTDLCIGMGGSTDRVMHELLQRVQEV